MKGSKYSRDRALKLLDDGQLLASKSYDNRVFLWRCDDWESVAVLNDASSTWWASCLEFHPTQDVLATLDEDDLGIRVWELDLESLLGEKPSDFVRYTSAKIVLVGESNVGKSCLAMKLAEGRYPTDSEQGTTHGIRFWVTVHGNRFR